MKDTQLAQQIESAAPRQHDIEDDQVRRALCKRGEPRGITVSGGDGEALCDEELAEHGGELAVVIYD